MHASRGFTFLELIISLTIFSLVAVIVYFWSDLIRYVVAWFRSIGRRRVETAEEMYDAVLARYPESDVVVMAAAIAYAWCALEALNGIDPARCAYQS